MFKPISTKVHGAIDLMAAAGLFALPRLLGWNERMTRIMDRYALGSLAYTTVTNYEWGIVKVLPMKGHLAVDAAAALSLVAAPALYSDEDPQVVATMVGLGLFELGAVAMSQTESPEEARARILEKNTDYAHQLARGLGGRVVAS